MVMQTEGHFVVARVGKNRTEAISCGLFRIVSIALPTLETRTDRTNARYWKIVLSEMHFFFLYYASRSVLGVLCARTLLQPFCGAVTKRAKCKNLERVLAPPRCKWWRLFLRPPSVLSYPPSFQSRTRLVAVLHKVPKRKDCLQTSPDTGKCLVRLWQSNQPQLW